MTIDVISGDPTSVSYQQTYVFVLYGLYFGGQNGIQNHQKSHRYKMYHNCKLTTSKDGSLHVRIIEQTSYFLPEINRKQ